MMEYFNGLMMLLVPGMKAPFYIHVGKVRKSFHCSNTIIINIIIIYDVDKRNLSVVGWPFGLYDK